MVRSPSEDKQAPHHPVEILLRENWPVATQVVHTRLLSFLLSLPFIPFLPLALFSFLVCFTITKSFSLKDTLTIHTHVGLHHLQVPTYPLLASIFGRISESESLSFPSIRFISSGDEKKKEKLGKCCYCSCCACLLVCS